MNSNIAIKWVITKTYSFLQFFNPLNYIIDPQILGNDVTLIDSRDIVLQHLNNFYAEIEAVAHAVTYAVIFRSLISTGLIIESD